jgi:hypothetical protein
MTLLKQYRPQPLWLRPFIGLCSIVFILLSLLSSRVQAQVTDRFNYEEISINMYVPRMGNAEIPAVIQGQVLFLSISDVFNFLEIKNTPSADFDSISGFFIHPLSRYEVIRANNYIIYEDVVYNLHPNSLLRTETGLYLRSDYFGEIFDLQCEFNFRALSVSLNTKVELPAIKKMQQEMMRQNIRLLKKEIKADTIITRSKGLVSLGMADWAVYSNQETNGISNTRLNLNMGARVAGGETNVNLNYNSITGFNKRDQYYKWRIVNNKNSLVRQLTAGRIWTQSTSSIFDPVTGIQITNTPTVYRKSFGTYRLTNSTEPGWTVELYVNNVLINFTKADASGFFSFDVPLVYGNSVVTMRAYGPYGEERVREEYINIPFNFLPVKEFEYTLSAGVVDDIYKSKFTRGNVNYGLTRRLTVGTGVEYLSSVNDGKPMPFVNASARVGSRILISGEHTVGVRSKAFLSYRLPSNFQVELNYILYEKNQTAIRYNYLEERKATLSYLIKANQFSGLTKLSINQVKLPSQQQTQAEWVVSGFYAGVSSNITTQAIFTDFMKPYVNSNLSLTFRLPAAIRFTPQIRYEFNQHKITSIRGDVEKQVFKRGFANVSYQTGNESIGNTFSVGFRYNFSFAQVGAAIRQSKGNRSTSVNASGSMLYNDKTSKLDLNYQTNVGRGAIVVLPFIDINGNGKRDKGEPKADGLRLQVRGGRMERNQKDTTITVTGLEAYNDYLVEIDKASFDNISWRINKPNIQVTIEPNHYKLIEVPVTVAGEVSGTVILDKKRNGRAGIGRMFVNIYKDDTTLVAKTLTEPDGYFSYLGLTPGTYKAAIDTAQMKKLNFCCPEIHSFNINTSFEGDIVDGIQFVITSPDTIPPAPIVIYQPPVQKDTIAKTKVDNKTFDHSKGKLISIITVDRKPISITTKAASATKRTEKKTTTKKRIDNGQSNRRVEPNRDDRNGKLTPSNSNNNHKAIEQVKSNTPLQPVAQPIERMERMKQKARAAMNTTGRVNSGMAIKNSNNSSSPKANNSRAANENPKVEQDGRKGVSAVEKARQLFSFFN